MRAFCVLGVCVLLQVGCAAGVGTGTLAGVLIAPERRSATTVITDQATHIKVQLALARNETIRQNCNISPLTFDRHVVLIGQAPNTKLRQEAEKIIRTLEGVTAVLNEVKVAANVGPQQRLEDTWITAQLKWKYYRHPDLGLNRISVTTENKTVYLLGILTPDEEAVSIRLARAQPGVKQVVNLIQALRL